MSKISAITPETLDVSKLSLSNDSYEMNINNGCMITRKVQCMYGDKKYPFVIDIPLVTVGSLGIPNLRDTYQSSDQNRMYMDIPLVYKDDGVFNMIESIDSWGSSLFPEDDAWSYSPLVREGTLQSMIRLKMRSKRVNKVKVLDIKCDCIEDKINTVSALTKYVRKYACVGLRVLVKQVWIRYGINCIDYGLTLEIIKLNEFKASTTPFDIDDDASNNNIDLNDMFD